MKKNNSLLEKELLRTLTSLIVMGTLIGGPQISVKPQLGQKIVAEAANTDIKEGMTTENLNLRKGAGTNYAIIKTLSKGQKLTILSRNDLWLKVKVGNQEGWVHSDWVEIKTIANATTNTSNTPSTSQTEVFPKKGITTENLNMRKGAGTTYTIIRTLPKGQNLTITTKNGTWLKVKAGNQDGWVHSDWVKVTDSNPKSTSTSSQSLTSTPPYRISGTTTERLNMRKGAGTIYKIIKTLPKGQQFTVISQSGVWLNVKAENQEGWVHSDWVNLTASNNSTILPQFNTSIGSAISSYPTNDKARSQNVELAASRINGVIINPGDSFSFTKLTGPVTEKNGYKLATVFSDGQLAKGIGGGICQVSSTIYWAQLRSGILPLERKSHSRAVGYVPLGLDATMWEGSIDYRFKNTTSYPIQLHITAQNGILTIEFLSDEKALNGMTYEPRTERTSATSTTESYKTYLRSYKDGQLVNETYIDSSSYRIK